MWSILKQHMRGAWGFALLAPLLMALEVVMDLMQPTLMSDIIDVGIAAGNTAYIFEKGRTMLLVALVGVVGGAGCTIFSSFAGMKFGATLRKAAFDRIQGFSFQEIDGFSTASLITRLTNDVTQLQNMVMMALRMLVRAPIFCVGGLIMAYALSPSLSLIFLVAMPVLFLSVLLIMRRAFPMFSKMQQKIDRVNAVMRENLLGARVVKAFVGQDREARRFGAANEDLMNTSMRASNLTVLLNPIVTLVLNGAIVALFWFGGRLAIGGAIETGKIMAFLTYLMQVLHSLIMVVMILMNLSRAQASANRVNEILRAESSIRDAADPRPLTGSGVEFDHVSFGYNDGAEYVLKDISFAVEPGQTVGIIGATGSGKSTLVSLIPRLYDVDEGAVRVGGVDVRELSQRELREAVGMSLQESVLFSGSIRENLRWANEDVDFSVIEQAARDAQAEPFIADLEEGYDAMIEQRGKNFSGGQKQRLSIARAFARQPRILILDDSTSAVDTATEARIRQAIARRGRDTTVFLIAQRISAIRQADRIVVLDGGRVSGMGTHDQLIRDNEIYRAIALSQLGEEALTNVG